MKIFQIIQAKQYRGAEIFCCQLSNHLINQGHSVEIVSIYNGDANLPFVGEIKSLNRNENDRYYDVVGWKKLAKKINDFKPDIVQANAADTLKYAVFSKIFFKWKAPLIFRNASSSSYYINNWLSKKVNSFFLSQVDLIISVSQASKKDLNNLFNFTTRKSLVIPVGIENNIALKNSAKKLFDSQNKNILHVGSFTSEKNHFGMLKIFKKINQKRDNIKLHLLGAGPLKKDILEDIHRLGIKNDVFIHKEIANALPYINEADLLILPSLVEGMPGVILEAMFCSTPVIAYNVGGVSEILNSKTGYLINKNDEDSFVDTVFRVLEEENEEKIRMAYSLILENFTNENIALKFNKAYSDLVS